MVTCTRCKSELPDKARYCPNCGKLVQATTHIESHQDIGQIQDQGTAIGVQTGPIHGDLHVAMGDQGPDPKALRRAYLHRVMQQTRRLPLSGVDPKAASDVESSELQIAAVYTALLTRSLDWERLEKEGRRPEFVPVAEAMQTDSLSEEDFRLSALEMLNRKPRLVLLGGPGSGKSTFVNFVALCLSGEALDDRDVNLATLTIPLPVEDSDTEPRPQHWGCGPLLPVRIALRDLAARGLPEPGQPVRGDTLWGFITAELGETLKEYAPHLKRELVEKGGLVLLDGLDEVPDANRRRAQVKKIVQAFADDFPLCRFLVTSRTYAYQNQEWKLEGFSETVLSDFAPAQIKYFVDRWYAHVGTVRGWDPDDTQGRAFLLKSAVEGGENLAELATRPLLLTLMASLHSWRGGSLPEKREQLYADVVDLLLDKWESPKVVRDAAGKPLVSQPSLAEWLKVDRSMMRGALNRLAFEAHRDQLQLEGTAELREEQLVSALMRVASSPDVNPVRIIEYVRDRAGLLAARGEGIYTFPHRTFQEYLAACHLTDHGFPDELADLFRKDPERWREVTVLAGAKAARGTSAGAWLLAEALCFRAPPPLDESYPEPDSLAAFLAAQTLVENEGQRLREVSDRNAAKLERIRSWLAAIVSRGWLSVLDRVEAGQALALLGDPRPGVGVDLETGLPDIVWCLVPAGAFVMGSPRQELDISYLAEGAGYFPTQRQLDGPFSRGPLNHEAPQHSVQLPSYLISRYPVTNSQYQVFREDPGGYRNPVWWTSAGWDWHSRRISPRTPGGVYELPNHPVVNVNWYEAVAFCRWLAQQWSIVGSRWKVWKEAGPDGPRSLDQDALRKLLDAGQSSTCVIRLPTEAEWEKAARGTDGLVFPWGDSFEVERSNMGESGISATCAVGIYPSGASPYDVLDLAGNVWEWCSTQGSNDYPFAIRNEWEDDYLDQVLPRAWRGGAFDTDRGSVRGAHRDWVMPNFRHWSLGFRLVMSC